MNVLSLFDGMSCGQIALKELGIKVENYFASEIDKYAIAQTQLNFPNTIQLGDVRNVNAADLPKIDLLIGGSPCQGFSFAGKMLNFKDPRSALFFEYVRILKECIERNPKLLFLLENVRMKKEHEKVITQSLGLYPVRINSSLVSAQNRERLYWTNIRTRIDGLFGDVFTDIPQPNDRGIVIKDIIEENSDPKYILSEKVIKNLIKHTTRNMVNGNGFGASVKFQNQKSNAVTVSGKGIRDLIVQLPRGYNKGNIYIEKAPTLTSNSYDRNNFLLECVKEPIPLTKQRSEYGKIIRKHYEAGTIKACRSEVSEYAPRKDRKSGTLTTKYTDTPLYYSGYIRRLTPTECARLQTIPDWYKWDCSDTQKYKMLGNGWTIEVIKHIFSFINK